MKAITLYPEWAWAVVNLDKRIENRSWFPYRDLIGTRIGIHAGRAFEGKQAIPLEGRRLAHAFEASGVFHMAREAGWDVSQEEHEDLGPGVLARFDKVIDGRPVRVELRDGDVRRGVLLGTAVLASAQENTAEDRQRWGVPNAVGWTLRDVRRLQVPTPVRGAQGLWELPPGLADQPSDVVDVQSEVA